MFSTVPKTNFNFSVTFILLSANAFNLEESKILTFGKRVKHKQLKKLEVMGKNNHTHANYIDKLISPLYLFYH